MTSTVTASPNVTAAPTAATSSDVATSSFDAAPTSFETHPLKFSQMAAVTSALDSGDSAQISSVLALPTSVTLDQATLDGLKELSPITVDQSTFQQLSDTGAQVYAKVGADQQDWTLLLLWENGTWQLADTVKGMQ